MLFVYLYSAFRHIFVDVAIDMQLNVVGRECFSETRYRGLKMALQRRGSKSRINQSIISMLIFFGRRSLRVPFIMWCRELR